jgi:hypothetical protein
MHDADHLAMVSAVRFTRGPPGSRDRREDPLQYDNYSTFLLEGSRRFPWASTLDPATADMSRRTQHRPSGSSVTSTPTGLQSTRESVARYVRHIARTLSTGPVMGWIFGCRRHIAVRNAFLDTRLPEVHWSAHRRGQLPRNTPFCLPTCAVSGDRAVYVT